MKIKDTKQIEDFVRQTSVQRDTVRKLVYQGKWQEAEPNEDRKVAFARRRVAKLASPGAESLVGTTIDLQGVNFLAEGAQVRRAVAHLDVTTPREASIGTGFLISSRLLITNWHVVPDTESARTALVFFDKELDAAGAPRAETTYGLDPDAFFLASDSDHLDYAVVGIGPRKAGTATIEELGFVVLSDDGDKHVIGMNVNIIQHPMGRPKMIAVRNNLLVYRGERSLLYETDTEVGSSGAPVFNDEWDLVALHHWGQPHLEETDNQRYKNVNEGIRISSIYADLKARLGEVEPVQRPLLEQALAYAGSAASREMQPRSRTLTPPGGGSAAPAPGGESLVVPNQATGDGLSFTIPIEVNVRLGSAPGTVRQITAVPQPRTERTLTRGAEAMRVDLDYDNRTGYDPTHISGTDISLPTVRGGASSRVAPLRAGEPHPERGELKYEHFSVKIDKLRRIALYSATNIDGATYLKIDRKTGEVVRDEEAEKWFIDPRISPTYVLEDQLYKDWSDFLDHGHVTRRNDPNWGTEESAERANADTYHLTNCSPQHWRFNESTRYWQGAERYVLEKGVLDADPRKSISVFQGPIFTDDDWMAGDVQLPSFFWKVVAWMGANERLKSVGLIVDQSQLMTEPRRFLGRPSETAPVNVAQWRVPVTAIEDRAGLDFDPAVVAADTMSSGEQPQVGGEALRPIRSFDDLLD